MNDNLLQRLVKETGINYLSDLHGHNHMAIYHTLDRISAEEYSLEEWEEAVGYILEQKKRKFSTSDAACRYLKCELKKITAGSMCGS